MDNTGAGNTLRTMAAATRNPRSRLGLWSATGPSLKLAPVVIAMAGWAAYSGSFSGPFVFDDLSSITENPTIRQLWPPWEALATPRTTVTVQGRPLLNLSFAVNYAISGYDVWSYHALNVLIHILAGLTLFGIVRRTLAGGCGQPPGDGQVSPPAFLPTEGTTAATAIGLAAALLWIVHPLQTESVTYVVQRAESLMGLFYLLTLYCFVRYAEPVAATPPKRWAVGSVLACLAGMATKEVMVSAPVMVLLYDRAFVAGGLREAWRKRREYYASLAVSWLMLGLCLLRGGGNRGGSIGLGTGISWWDYAATQFEALGRYMILSIWPSPLVFEYGAFKVQDTAEVLPWALLVVPAATGTLWALWRWPRVGFLGGWFFAMLAPTSLVPGTSQMIVEHRMYLSLAAVVVLAVWVASRLAADLGGGGALGRLHPAGGPRPAPSFESRAAPGRRSIAVCLIVTGLVVAALGGMTWKRNVVYRSALALWADTVAKRPGNPLAHYMLAEELLTVGRLTEARWHLTEAIRLHPPFFLAHERLGELLVRLGETAEAIAHFETALRQKPDFADAHANLGHLLAAQNRLGEARHHLARAVALHPDFAEARAGLASLERREGRGAEAIALYEHALRLKPTMAAAHLQLAEVLADFGRNAEAVGHFREGLRMGPASAAAEYNLANALAALQRQEDAIVHYRSALRLKSDFPAAAYNLGNSLAALKRYAEAIAHYREALRLKPDYTAAAVNLGSACFALGRLPEAEAHYLAALRLEPGSEEVRVLLERVRAVMNR